MGASGRASRGTRKKNTDGMPDHGASPPRRPSNGGTGAGGVVLSSRAINRTASGCTPQAYTDNPSVAPRSRLCDRFQRRSGKTGRDGTGRREGGATTVSPSRPDTGKATEDRGAGERGASGEVGGRGDLSRGLPSSNDPLQREMGAAPAQLAPDRHGDDRYTVVKSVLLRWHRDSLPRIAPSGNGQADRTGQHASQDLSSCKSAMTTPVAA